jgi:hypothetical protein
MLLVAPLARSASRPNIRDPVRPQNYRVDLHPNFRSKNVGGRHRSAIRSFCLGSPEGRIAGRSCGQKDSGHGILRSGERNTYYSEVLGKFD